MPRLLLLRGASLAALLGAAGCGFREVQGPPGEEQVVVQGVLSADASEQVLWIERTTAAGDPISFGFRPLVSPPTRVEVRDAAGAVFSYQVDTANAARFVASFTPVHGQHYELLVEAGAHVLRGSTTVPAPLTIVDPAADTVPFPGDSGLRVSWGSGSSPWVLIHVSGVDAPLGARATLVRRDTTGVVPRYYFYGSAPVTVTVFAVDSVTARVTDPFGFGDFSRGFDGNLTGSPGFFGAATSDRVVARPP
jgi:Domain of unknown function (DUF4249)